MTIAGVIPAAGRGSRLGGVAKALLDIDGAPYLTRIVRTMREHGVADVIVIVGPPFGDRVAVAARALGEHVAVIENPSPERGMASSIACGFRALASCRAEAAWLWPVDHPQVTAATLGQLVAGLGRHQVVRPRYAGHGGHPALIARSLWRAMAGCEHEPEGARSILRSADGVWVDVDDRGVIRDVDEPHDLAQGRP